jgi:hypothetical protein
MENFVPPPSPTYNLGGFATPMVEDTGTLITCKHCGKEYPFHSLHQCPEGLLYRWNSYDERGFVYVPEDPPLHEPVPHTPCSLSVKPQYGKFRDIVSDGFAARPYLVGFTDKNSWENMSFHEYRERVKDAISGVPAVNTFFDNVAQGADIEKNFMVKDTAFMALPLDHEPPREVKSQGPLDYAVTHWFKDSFFYFEKFLADVDRSLSTSKLDLMAHCPIYCSSSRLKRHVAEKLDQSRFPVVDDADNAVIYIADENFSLSVAKKVKAVWAFSWIARSVSDCQGGHAEFIPNGTVNITHLRSSKTRKGDQFYRRVLNLANMSQVTEESEKSRYSYHPLGAFDGGHAKKKKVHTPTGVIPGGVYPTVWSRTVGVMRILKHEEEIEYFKPLTRTALSPNFNREIQIDFPCYRLTNQAVFSDWRHARFFPRRANDVPVHWITMSNKNRSIRIVSTPTIAYVTWDVTGTTSELCLHGFAIKRGDELINPITYGVAGRIGITPSPFSNEFTMRAFNKFGGIRFVKSYALEGPPTIEEPCWGFFGEHASALIISNGNYCSPFSPGWSEDSGYSLFHPPLSSTPRFDQFASNIGLNDYKRKIRSALGF